MTIENVELNKKYWDSFYARTHKNIPSQFCISVLTEIKPDAVVVELGSGNGRDSHYFASQGHITLAMDLSEQAIKSCNEESKSRNIQHATFFRGDITKSECMKTLVDYARELSAGRDVVFYSRFVMHSLNDEQELKFLNVLSDFIQENEVMYFEFRSLEDAALEKHFDGHYRRFVDTEKFKQILKGELGFSIEYSITGKGMAKYKKEDPFVSRLTIRKK